MPQTSDRNTRVEARIPPDTLAMVKRAAEIQGRSVSEFMAAAAQEAAMKTIEESQVIRLTVEEQKRFVELLLDPPEPSATLLLAQEDHARLIESSR
ncbi:MAG: DUF1778 domain-containing protein [Candidatus Methylumidiphilus sp.]